MKKRIGILADIHGNLTALKAVIAHAKAQGVDEYWLLGDVLLPGPGDKDLLALLRQLSLTACLKGNWEENMLLVNQQRKQKPPLLQSASQVYFYRMCQYVLERLEPADLLYLSSFSDTALKTVAGLQVGLYHHLPGKKHGRNLVHHAPQEEFDKLFEDNQHDIVVFGHVHMQLLRYGSQGQLIVNPGSIGQPYFPWEPLKKDLRAQYTILELDEQGIPALHFYKVAYDVEAELALARKKELPYLQLYEDLLYQGNLHTHNEELLATIHKKYPYEKEVEKWLAQD
ncbi:MULTISPECIES: metallophosphoesterase [unclassified Streptococcus]|uniref:metallophosphoesterase family protein n=1 Tax=unclassified Streptococcus TaxID=2608887 RepID=UPI00107279F5|nr:MULTISPECIES: metallophosphoesterase family protein [unclassified Streptococcus]MBF0786574.1 metallophosphoesterase family protein [Streptococcus sp. 19428wC2_LYSM12]MCQ9210933.1 metallophosphoesterase family protein [Streptococcus sp. B01]MCQ9214202.1 metallophosphoesterase family protein [Streptococcus sp. O1]TFV06537.1 metallophosphoesterase [Streptococcus sp. LYSM12]